MVAALIAGSLEGAATLPRRAPMTRSAQTPRWQFLYVAIAPAHAERQVPYLAAPILGRLVEPLCLQPLPVTCTPGLFARISPAIPQHHMKRSPGACGEVVNRCLTPIGSARKSLMCFIRPQTSVSSPARSNRASCIASHRFVLTLSPGFRGIIDGATMPHLRQLPIQTIPRGSGFIAEVQPRRDASQGR